MTPTRRTPYFQTDFAPEEFRERRRKLAASLPDGSAIVLAGACETGAFDPFRQSNDFYYLSGVETPHAYLKVEVPSGRTTLYLPPHDPKHERSEGTQLNCDFPDEAVRITGVDRIGPWGALSEDLRNVTRVATPFEPAECRQACRDTLRFQARQRRADPWDGRMSREEWFRGRILEACPQMEFFDLSPTLDRMRLLKSDSEIGLMRRAGELTALAVLEAFGETREGRYEYELAAVADKVFLSGGAFGPGYRAIVASGQNIWNAHYFRNNCRLRNGDLVLMDYAPDVGCYTSDIGRIWPVGGRYSARQRSLYGFVVEYHKCLLQVIRPGYLADDLATEAAQRMTTVWEQWPFASAADRLAARTMLDSTVAFTHPVGMAVHDVGEYRAAPLEPGLVFALDPQLWIHDEEIYIRVEDTVVVTAKGCESLTQRAPLDLSFYERGTP